KREQCFGKAKRKDHTDDFDRYRGCDARTSIKLDDLRAVVKITHPVNSVVKG
ncbi:hypothetical protein HC111_003972, partial [Salmonella enterica subsp. enterica serovar Enteritidis]|nr:hypothetical protein [Salmonella enterica subsp. enterica serovar Enteritidis]